MTNIVYKTFDASFNQFEHIDYTDYISAFNALKELCTDNDIIVLANSKCVILKPIDTYIEKLLASDCDVGCAIHGDLTPDFKLYDDDTQLSTYDTANFNFILINCKEFKNTTIEESYEFGDDTNIYERLSLAGSIGLRKIYVFPLLFLDSTAIPSTLDFMDSCVAKFEDIDPPFTFYNSDVLLDHVHTESELIHKRTNFPLNCLILFIKQLIIKRILLTQPCELELI